MNKNEAELSADWKRRQRQRSRWPSIGKECGNPKSWDEFPAFFIRSSFGARPSNSCRHVLYPIAPIKCPAFIRHQPQSSFPLSSHSFHFIFFFFSIFSFFFSILLDIQFNSFFNCLHFVIFNFFLIFEINDNCNFEILNTAQRTTIILLNYYLTILLRYY